MAKADADNLSDRLIRAISNWSLPVNHRDGEHSISYHLSHYVPDSCKIILTTVACMTSLEKCRWKFACQEVIEN